jgi:hypothetical protein
MIHMIPLRHYTRNTTGNHPDVRIVGETFGFLLYVEYLNFAKEWRGTV